MIPADNLNREPTMAKPQLRTVELDSTLAEQDAAEAVDAAASELGADVTDRPKTRIKQALDWTVKLIADLVPQEQELQSALAAADAKYESTVAQAHLDREQARAEITANLKQVTALRAATTVFQGELRKSEA